MRVTRPTISKAFELTFLSSVAFSLVLAGCSGGSSSSGTGGTGGRAGGGGAGTTAAVGGTTGGGGAGRAGATAAGGAASGGMDAGVAGGTTSAGGSSGTVGTDAGVDSGRADVAPATPEVGNADRGVNPPADAGADVPVLPADAADAPLADTSASGDVGGADSDGSSGACLPARWDDMIDVSTLSGLGADKDGNLFVAFTLYPPIDPNNPLNLGSGPVTSAGSADLAIAKLDPATGSAVWTKTFGDVSDQNASQLAVAKSGQVGVIGTFTGSMTVGNAITNAAPDPIDFIVAVDSTGKGLWAKAINTVGGGLLAIASNSAQDAFAVCGYTMGAATDLVPDATASSDGLEDILVAKINATTGAVLWSRQIGGAGTQLCTALAMDAAGNVYASGTYNGTLDLGPGAFSPAPAAKALAIWAGKLDTATGTGALAKSWGNALKQQVKAVALDAAGNLVIAGSLKGVVPFGSLTLSTAGTGAGADAGASVAGNTDAFAVKLDTSLNPLWAHNWGDTANQDVRCAAFDSRGDLIVAGSLIGTFDLGNGATLTAATGADSYNNPQADVYWMKLRGDSGAVLCGQRYGDDFTQQADLMVLSRAASGPQADAVTLAGHFEGIVDFGLASGSLIAGVPGTSSSNHVATFLSQIAP